MTCKNCGKGLQGGGRGKPRQYCPGGECEKAYRQTRWVLGGKALNRRTKRVNGQAPKRARLTLADALKMGVILALETCYPGGPGASGQGGLIMAGARRADFS